MVRRSGRPNAVTLIGTCQRCGESVELIVSKKQVKALYKAFKAGSAAEAEKIAEKILGRNKKGDLKF